MLLFFHLYFSSYSICFCVFHLSESFSVCLCYTIVEWWFSHSAPPSPLSGKALVQIYPGFLAERLFFLVPDQLESSRSCLYLAECSIQSSGEVEVECGAAILPVSVGSGRCFSSFLGGIVTSMNNNIWSDFRYSLLWNPIFRQSDFKVVGFLSKKHCCCFLILVKIVSFGLDIHL